MPNNFDTWVTDLESKGALGAIISAVAREQQKQARVELYEAWISAVAASAKVFIDDMLRLKRENELMKQYPGFTPGLPGNCMEMCDAVRDGHIKCEFNFRPPVGGRCAIEPEKEESPPAGSTGVLCGDCTRWNTCEEDKAPPYPECGGPFDDRPIDEDRR